MKLWLDSLRLRSGSAGTRRKAIERLVSTKDARVPRLLRPSLQDSDPAIRCACLRAMAKLAIQGSTDVFVAALRDADSSVRIVAAQSLEQSEDSRRLRPLLAATLDVEPNVRAAALYALRHEPSPE